MTMLRCKIPDELDARLDEVARQTRVTKSKVVRTVLEQAVQKGSRSRTAFGLVKKLSGSLSGPIDLATNPKYLESLGE